MSLVMFLLIVIQICQTLTESNYTEYRYLFCEKPTRHSTGSLYYISYLYYLSKYYELLDTVFVSLKGKLQGYGGFAVYHHTTVLIMSYLWLSQTQSLQFTGVLANTCVHIVMYYYYYLTALGKTVWWKRYITLFQVVEFIYSFFALIPYLYYMFNGYHCAGFLALLFNSVFNITLLIYFVRLYRRGNKKHSQ
ncbi:unnamed protein product [Didymodactylos carnosus]|uniref:Elongation of very long chain fatty acids protein n=1 Tax=Didymodactylos carnosus TaxID=1234261 RepID=A0A815R432_9BILA|nr:unnamed protein product [Didymodactylos carnosus]CAF4338577.1 unnamed protein product [Didymodactylos carnosus]